MNIYFISKALPILLCTMLSKIARCYVKRNVKMNICYAPNAFVDWPIPECI